MLLPAFLLYTVFILAPIFISLYYSFTKYTGIGAPVWIGWQNYERLLHNELFFRSIKNSMTILGAALVVLLPLSFLCAVLLQSKWHGNSAAKTILYAPAVMPGIVVGIIWIYIYEPSYGLLNSALSAVGLDALRQQWIGGLTLTPYSVGLVYCWRNVGFMTTIFIAAIKGIPEELYESASIEGAGAWQRMLYITIPMIKYAFSVVIVQIINGTLKVFETVIQLTNGGPNHYSETMVTYSYNVTFRDGKYGYGMSMAVVVFLICLVFSVTYLWISRARDKI